MSTVESIMWTQTDAVGFATDVEAIAPQFGCHVALTGGCLYKAGSRKDCDLVLYRIRQIPKIDRDGLFKALATIGLLVVSDYGFCVKCKWEGRLVDLLFPEEASGDYIGQEDAL